MLLTKSKAMMGGFLVKPAVGGLGLGEIHPAMKGGLRLAPAMKGGYNAYAKNKNSRSKSTFSKYSKSRRYKRGKGIRKTRKHKSR
jgi:hypothetical protein